MEAKANPGFKVILGSSSIARRKILADMGYEFTTMSADIDEKAIRKDKPEELVVTLAEAKADAILSKLRSTENQDKDEKPTILIAADTVTCAKPSVYISIDAGGVTKFHLNNYCRVLYAEAIIPKLPIYEFKADAEPTLLVTCDQVVVYEGVIREKPSSKDEARQFIEGYSGGHCSTVSSVVVTNLKTGIRKRDWDKVEIHFQDIPDKVIDSLIEEGDVLYVAGALIIEHPLILPYVKEVVGTMDSVMGLPKALTEKLMKEVL